VALGCSRHTLALALAVGAADVFRTPGELTSDDANFESAPLRQRNLWKVGSVPGLVSERLLGSKTMSSIGRSSVCM